MGNLIIKPNTGGLLKLQDEGGTDAISISTTGNTTLAGTANALGTVASGTLGTSVVFSSFVGMIAPFAMASPPTGWLVCDGSAVARAGAGTYAALFAAISTTWGTGDGSTTFNVPDLEGAFLRGSGTSTLFTEDSTITLAAVQSDTFQGHHHSITNTANSDTATASGAHSRMVTGSASSGVQPDIGAHAITVDNPETGSNNSPRIGDETRPNNIGVKYCIKY
jgi:microcystin-dependent protein